MADKHANMPGMGEQAKKPEQGKPAEKAQPVPKPETDKSTEPATSGHQHKSG